MMFKPMYDRLYVKRLEDKEEKTDSGLIIASENKSAIARGEVIEAGFGYRIKCDEIPCPLVIQEGDIVVFQKYAGIDAGNDHIFLKEEEVLAIDVSEVDSLNAEGSYSASQTVTYNRAPTINDSKNFILGCFWLQPSTVTPPADNSRIWILTALLGNQATWTEFVGSGAGILSVNGIAPIVVNTVAQVATVSLSNGTNGQVLIGGGTGPVWNNITSTGGTVAITNGVNSINLEVTGGQGADSFPTNSGTAAPVAGILNVLGSGGIATSGSGNTVGIIKDYTNEYSLKLSLSRK